MILQETSFSSSQPVTRSLSSVGKKPLTSTSRLPVLGQYHPLLPLSHPPPSSCCFYLSLPPFYLPSTAQIFTTSVTATNLSKSNSVNNKNSLNNKFNNSDNRVLTNGTNSNLINNNETIKNTNSKVSLSDQTDLLLGMKLLNNSLPTTYTNCFRRTQVWRRFRPGWSQTASLSRRRSQRFQS